MNPRPVPDLAALRLLRVDDYRVCALLFEDALRLQVGVGPRPAEAADEALDQVRGRCPDVLVPDARLPGMVGFQRPHLLRGEPPPKRVPAFMGSADATPEDVSRGRHAGIEGCRPKAIHIRRVMDDIARVRADLTPARA